MSSVRSQSNDALVGIERCGCVTYANSRPDCLTRSDERALGRILADGGQALRITAEEARALPSFLPLECPHEPKGWI